MNLKLVFIISFRDFRDAEYFVTKEALEIRGIEIATASNEKGLAIGAEGGEVNIDLLISKMNLSEFNGVVFIGGPGCLKYLDNDISVNLIKEVIKKKKLLAAICISPVILAKAGVLKGKKATVWSSTMDKGAVQILKEGGANFQDEQVVADGNLITANGPLAAFSFGEAIADYLRKKHID